MLRRVGAVVRSSPVLRRLQWLANWLGLPSAEGLGDLDDGLASDSRLQRGITAAEYRASENGRGLQAPNRAHGLRT
ncbi:MAG TPA: hypothetical protein EYP62_09240, partial [Kiritimatiellae bacterium]|nr:hypothetical protein [Kiritimatiellia bacterium]